MFGQTNIGARLMAYPNNTEGKVGDIIDHSVYVPSQWEMELQGNVISHWLGAHTEWFLDHVFYKLTHWGRVAYMR